MNENFIKDIYLYASNVREHGKYNKIGLDALIKYKEKYLLMFFLTKKAFIKIDPANIGWVSSSEYDIEIIEIAYKLCSIEWKFNLIQKIVFNTLKQYFSPATVDYKGKAKKISNIIFYDYFKYKENFSFHKDFKKLNNFYCKKYC
jgi:hypothetical protein